MKAKAVCFLCVLNFVFVLAGCKKEDNAELEPLECNDAVFTAPAVITDSIQMTIDGHIYTCATYGNGMGAVYRDSIYSLGLACSWYDVTGSNLRVGQMWFNKLFNKPETTTAERYEMLLPNSNYGYSSADFFTGAAIRVQYKKAGVADEDWRSMEGDNSGNIFTIESRSAMFVQNMDTFCRVSGRFCCRLYNYDQLVMPVSGRYSTPVKLTYH